MPICTARRAFLTDLKFGTALLENLSPNISSAYSRAESLQEPRKNRSTRAKSERRYSGSLHRLRNRLKLKFIRTLLEDFGKAHEFYSAIFSAICILRGARNFWQWRCTSRIDSAVSEVWRVWTSEREILTVRISRSQNFSQSLWSSESELQPKSIKICSSKEPRPKATKSRYLTRDSCDES